MMPASQRWSGREVSASNRILGASCSQNHLCSSSSLCGTENVRPDYCEFVAQAVEVVDAVAMNALRQVVGERAAEAEQQRSLSVLGEAPRGFRTRLSRTASWFSVRRTIAVRSCSIWTPSLHWTAPPFTSSARKSISTCCGRLPFAAACAGTAQSGEAVTWGDRSATAVVIRACHSRENRHLLAGRPVGHSSSGAGSSADISRQDSEETGTDRERSRLRSLSAPSAAQAAANSAVSPGSGITKMIGVIVALPP